MSDGAWGFESHAAAPIILFRMCKLSFLSDQTSTDYQVCAATIKMNYLAPSWMFWTSPDPWRAHATCTTGQFVRVRPFISFRDKLNRSKKMYADPIHSLESTKYERFTPSRGHVIREQAHSLLDDVLAMSAVNIHLDE